MRLAGYPMWQCDHCQQLTPDIPDAITHHHTETHTTRPTPEPVEPTIAELQTRCHNHTPQWLRSRDGTR